VKWGAFTADYDNCLVLVSSNYSAGPDHKELAMPLDKAKVE
jgi:hypothetical protein